MELGGPDVGRGCGGRGIIHGFELLERLGFHDWDFDYVLLDFLGDVVCGGFGLPIARDLCQKAVVVGSNDLQSLYVANNVCSAVEYFRRLGGNVGVAGMVINKDDGTGEARQFAEAVGIPVLATIPANDEIRRLSASYQIVGRPGDTWAPLFEQLADNLAEAPPLHPRPLGQAELLAPFSARDPGAVAGRRRHPGEAPAEEVRRGVGDLDIGEGAHPQRVRAGEVDQLVLTGAARGERLVLARQALDHDLLHPPDAAAVLGQRRALPPHVEAVDPLGDPVRRQ